MIEEVCSEREIKESRSSFTTAAADILSSFRNSYVKKEEIKDVENKKRNDQVTAATDVLSSFRNNYVEEEESNNTEKKPEPLNKLSTQEERKSSDDEGIFVLLNAPR